MRHRQTNPIFWLLASLTLLIVVSTAHAGKLSVISADPDEAEQESTALEILVNGEGFDDGSLATFLVSGTKNDTGGVQVLSTEFVNPNRLRVTINIDSAATLGSYDILVQTSRGRRGKGGTLFKVLEKSGGNQGYNGEPIPQDCWFSDEPSDNVISDGLGPYQDSVDKVACGVHDASLNPPAGIAIDTVGEGAVKKAPRKIDLALGPCLGPDCGWIDNRILTAAEDIDGMENVRLAARPYSEQDDLQYLPSGEHLVSLRIQAWGLSDRYVVQFMNREIPSEFHQGSFCDLGQNPNFDPIDAVSDDMTVYVWPDQDFDTIPDGYTVTTGSIGDTTTMPPEVIPGSRTGTVCSNDGPVRCGGPGRSDMCNLLGTVEVQYTMHATNQ